MLGQSHQDIEYLIVDGASTDGSLDYLSQVSEQDDRVTLVSEPDKGLYDALNKGVRLTTGDVIGFVHADDFLAHADVLKHLAVRFEDESTEAVYGDLQYVAERLESGRKAKLEIENSKAEEAGGADEADEADEAPPLQDCNTAAQPHFSIIRHWESGAYDRAKLAWGWMPPHPTLYLRKAVYQRAQLASGEYFDTSYSCAADYDFMMRVLSQFNVTPDYLPEVTVKMRVGGVSNRSLKHMLRKSAEDWRAIRRNNIGHLHTLAWKNLSKVSQFIGKE